MTHVRLLTGLMAVTLGLSGCASEPGKPVLAGPVAVVPVRFAPQSDFNAYARGKGAAAGQLGMQSAAKGAAAGAVVPLSMGPVGVAAYPLIAPFTILAGVVVGGTVGAAYGAINGLPAEQAELVSKLVDQAVGQIGAHEQVARRVAELIHGGEVPVELLPQVGPAEARSALDYADLKPGFRSVVELAVEKVGMAARKGDPPRIALEMKLHVRVLSLGDVAETWIRNLEWSGKPHPIAEWRTGGAALLAAEFDQGYETLAQYTWETLLEPAMQAHGNTRLPIKEP